MKKYLIILGILINNFCQAQNIVALEYFFDTDPGFGNGIQSAITPSPNIANHIINANVSTLTQGIHQLYIRSKDATGVWSITNRSFFYKTNTTSSSSLPDIVALEYFFNTDPGFGNATQASITPNTNIANLNINSDVTALTQGIHQLYIRSKDATGVWSITNRSFFYKTNTTSSSSLPDIVALEYFFNTDPGFGNATQASITPNTNIVNLNINSDVSTLAQGIHQLYIRSKDANGAWSITNRSFFYKTNTTSSSSLPDIVALEYFFNTDPGFGNATQASITPNTNIVNLNINSDVSTLAQGIHQLYIRSKDANGAWSVTNRSFFYKTGNANSTTNPNIVKLEYFFDADPGFGNGIDVPITPSQNIANINILPNIINVGLGAHLISVRSQDANGAWSITNSIGFLRDSVKLFLQGFYAGGGSMTPALLNQGESVDPNVADSITLRLHQQNYPYQTVVTTKGVLNIDGTLSIFFTDIDPTQNYWLSIQHRNSIETWSANAINFSSNPSYDFTTAASQAYGNNQKEVETGVWAIYSGDVNQDSNIDLLDIGLVEGEINNFASGYVGSDVNGDGNADLLDAPIVENNINAFVFSIHP